MSHCLFQHTFPCIDQNDRHISSTCSGYHIACVLDMSRSVGDNKFSGRCCKIPVSHINGNSLFPFCPQSVSKQRKINILLAQAFTRLDNMFHLIFKYRFAVIKKSSDQCTLTVINTSCGCKPQQTLVCYFSPFIPILYYIN